MGKTKQFSIEDIDKIKKFLISQNSDTALVRCSHIGTYQSKMKCPDCNKRWKRLPNESVFKELTELYEATDAAWAAIFSTDRSSVTRLREKINPKIKKPIWNQQRYEVEIKNNDGFLDRQPIEDFLLLIQKFPNSNVDTLLKVSGLNKDYFKLILKNDIETRDKYNALIKLNETLDNDYLYCHSCKIRKRIIHFKKFGEENIPAKVCKTCINERERNKLLLDQNKMSSVLKYPCKYCKKDFEADFSAKNGDIFCEEHRKVENNE